MNGVVHANAVGNTANLDNILFGHAQQIRTGKMGKSGHVLGEAMMVHPLDQLRRSQVFIDDNRLERNQANIKKKIQLN